MSRDEDRTDALCRARYLRVRSAMSDRRVDALLLSRQANAYYTSGARRVQVAGSAGGVPWVLVNAAEDAPFVFTPDLDGLPSWLAGHGRPLCWNASRVVDAIAGFGARRIAYDVLSPRFVDLVEAAIPHVEWQDGEALMLEATAVKSADEIERIEKAVNAAERAVEAAIADFRAGADETRVRATAMSAAIEAGGGFLAREVGCRMSADRKRIEIEVAVVRDGYQGESAATGFARGLPRGAYADWSRIAKSIVDSCRPGAVEADVCRLADVVVRSIGTGVERTAWPLRPGMVLVITVDAASVRAKVTLAVGEDGARRLSRSVEPTA